MSKLPKSSTKPITRLSGLKKGPSLFTKGPDKAILMFTLIMALFGLIMIFEGSIYRANTYFGDQFHFLKLQFLWVLIGMGIATFLYLFDYHKLAKLSGIGLIVIVIMLIAVLVVGEGTNGSKRWFEIGPIPIQPAEFLKPMIIIFLASWLSKETRSTTKVSSFKEFWQSEFGVKTRNFLIILGFILALVVLEPDLGTTLVIAITALAIFYMSGTETIHKMVSIAIGFLMMALGLFAGIIAPYRFSRITTFVDVIRTGQVSDPLGSGMQMQQILTSIGSGGFWGKGFGQSRQRLGYLVENTAFTDSTIAVVLEELGFIGGIMIIGAWILFFFRGLFIARTAPDRLGQLLAVGITVWLVVQAFMNIAANLALMPLTGIPLPFLTYGGSSTIATFIGIGILLNISRQRVSGK